MLSLGECLAGLGLLFIGLRLMSSQLQRAMGRRIRVLLKAATRTIAAGFSAGVLAGAVTQSSNAVAVIAGNLVRARALSTREAIPVVAGGNVGTSALVLLAAVNFHLAVLFLVGLVGIGFQLGFDRRAASRGWMSIALGLALLFLGIDFIKAAPHALDGATFADWMAGLTPMSALALGLVAALVTQSSSTATILVLAALKAGVIGIDSCYFAVVGANFGSGLATLVASGGLMGVGRQLCLVHIMVKGLGSGLLLVAYLAAPMFGLDPTAFFLQLGHSDAARAVSMLFLLLQLCGALPVSILRSPVARLAMRFSPPTLEDDVSRPRFVDPDAAADPSGALELSAAEIEGLIHRLPNLLPDLDTATPVGAAGLQVLWRGSKAVAETTDAFVIDLIRRGLSSRDLDTALAQQSHLEMLRALQDTLAEFSALISTLRPAPALAFNLSESLRAIVIHLADTAGSEAEDFDWLIGLTGDRSEHLNRIRRQLAASAHGAEADTQRLVLATSQFERAIWLVHRLAIALRPSVDGDQASSEAAANESATGSSRLDAAPQTVNALD
ncbi:Na/Pi symporter [Kaistia algarum]|uniref:Na/Pi symporter n=1 Tax=Kaistia algarum TaxID=2083279 RepID=UPI001403624B|nr:Na/Pi symporter [Kaistia algarum]MCX5515974.1 Na/Pi symporter [Kaistia algarum]